MGALFKREPAVIIGAIMAVVALLVTFFPNLLSAEQQDAFEQALWLIIPLIVGGTIATRQSVYAPAHVVAVTSDKPGVEAVAGPASHLPNGEPVVVLNAPPA